MYTLESRVRYSECNETGTLSLVSAMNYLQDCSSFHSESIGRGFDVLAHEGLAWVLAAWQIEITRLPRFGEKITVDTWAYDLSGLSASRCFVIRDHTGAPVLRAESAWYMIDTVAGKATRIPQSEQAYLDGTPRLAMPPMPKRISLKGSAQSAPRILVTQQHLDTNRHVNNAQYVMMTLDALGETGQTCCGLHRIIVQYRRQAHLDDSITPRIFRDEAGISVSLGDTAGKAYAIVRLEDK